MPYEQASEEQHNWKLKGEKKKGVVGQFFSQVGTGLQKAGQHYKEYRANAPQREQKRIEHLNKQISYQEKMFELENRKDKLRELRDKRFKRFSSPPPMFR